MAIDLAPLWNFGEPEVSEQRFRSALSTATGDDALILQTQIARTYGLRRDFAKAQEDDAKKRARAAYMRAHEVAKSGQLDGLAVDALHMLAFVDTAPSDQLNWGQQALAIAQASSQPSAKNWEASLRNNVGYALHQLGRYEEALAQFKHAVVLRERGTDAQATRIAHWMVAWTLRAQHRTDEALEIQARLERECDAAGAPDPYVFEELELLYRDKGDETRASHYAGRRKALPK